MEFLGCLFWCLFTASAKEVLIFEDNFDKLDFSLWKHDITMSGGGNWEFQLYTNNRTNSYTENGILYLQPSLTSDTIGEDEVSGNVPYTMDIWGLGDADQCTSNAYWGCLRVSDAANRHPLNPVTSAKISTTGSFSYTYGRFEVEAKLPRGDWLWPAIWLLPQHNAYGGWPASGEIDLLESRGNSASYSGGGCNIMSSCLHWGTYVSSDRWYKTYKTSERQSGETTYAEEFHTFGFIWDESGLTTYVDSPDNVILSEKFDAKTYDRGEFVSDGTSIKNPWSGSSSDSAPFDQSFFIILNVAVGGVGGYFEDNSDKPWSNTDNDALAKFLETKNDWYPTWNGKDSALQINSIRVWQDEKSLDFTCNNKKACPLITNSDLYQSGSTTDAVANKKIKYLTILSILLGILVVFLVCAQLKQRYWRSFNRRLYHTVTSADRLSELELE